MLIIAACCIVIWRTNVLVDSNGHRLVTDFGLAKRLSDTDRSLTEAGAVLGTPRYMSPEQADGRKDLTVAADVYSLGVMLYERLTGQTPFVSDNVPTLLRQVRELEPPRPSAVREGLIGILRRLCSSAWRGHPRRYASAEASAEDLGNRLAGRPSLRGRWGRRSGPGGGAAATPPWLG